MDKIDLRYQRGKIYTVRCYDDDTAIYVGSTIEPLSARMSKHRCSKKCSLYQYVNGNWENWYIELYEEYPCNNKQLLQKREGEIIRLIGNINKKDVGRTRKEHYESNKEQLIKKQKEYYEANKKTVLEYKKKYHEANKKKINENKKVKVICDHCWCELNKSSLKTHQKSKKCLENPKYILDD